MSDKIIQVNIVTPDGVVFTHRAYKVDVVTVMGGLTILPNHMPIVTSLAIGPVSVKRVSTNEMESYIAVNGGLLEFNQNVCNIIADTAERSKDIDVHRAQLAKERAEEELSDAEDHHDIDRMNRAKIALNKAINRIGVSQKNRP